jgi:predicted helicase
MSTFRPPTVSPAPKTVVVDRYQEDLTPEATLEYVSAVLYSPLYRRRYRQQLRRGFPRIAFPRRPGSSGSSRIWAAS